MNTSPYLTVPCPSTGNPSLGLLFRQVRDLLWAAMARELSTTGHDLTFSQFVTIKVLANGTPSVTDLARAAELNPGAMTRLLDKLEAKGLVRREADPGDRRALHIHLTDAGTAIWHDMERCSRRVQEHAQRGMSPEQRTLMFELLERVRDNLLRQD